MRFLLCIINAIEFFIPMNKIALSLLTSGFFITGCSALTGSDDVVHERYADYSAARVDHGLENGWLPRRMPVSARNIEEVHNVDSGEIWIRFSYDEGGLKEFIGQCVEDASVSLPDSRRSARSAGWWPRELTNALDSESRSRWTLFNCPRMDHAGSFVASGVAVDRSAKLVFYWVAKR